MGIKLHKTAGSGGGASDSFTIIQTDAGTAPTADSATDTVTLTSTDLTITGNSATDTVTFAVANDAVTNTKLANMATQTIKGRTTAGTGDPEDLTAAQATAILSNFVGDSGSGGTKGLVPAPSAGDSGKYLKGDGTWGTVTAGLGGSTGANDNVLLRSDGTGGATVQASTTHVTDSGYMALGSTSAPNYGLDIVGSSGNATYLQVRNSDTGTASTDGLIVGFDSSENAWIKHQESGKNLNIFCADSGIGYIYMGGQGITMFTVNAPYGKLTTHSSAVLEVANLWHVGSGKQTIDYPGGGGQAVIQSGFGLKRSTSGDTNATVDVFKMIHGVTALTAARTITLNVGVAGQIYIVKDESGNAGTYNITVQGAGGATIDGAASATINTNYGVMRLYTDGSTKFFTF